jgi:peptide/nickel transport system substrate-binding protein
MLTGSGDARVSQVEGGRIIYVGMRCDKAPLSDKRVRQALNYAVDFDTINKQLFGGVGTRAASVVNPPHVNPELKPYPYDPAKAKALLAAAGVGDGFSLVMDSPNGRYLKDLDLAQAVAQNLAAVGVKTEVRPQDWSVYIGDMVFKQATDPLYLLGLGSSFSGQEELSYIEKGYIANATYWNNPQYFQLYDQLTTTLDPTKRQNLMNQMQTIAFDDPPLIYLWHQVDSYGVSNRLQWEARADEYIYMYDAKLT